MGKKGVKMHTKHYELLFVIYTDKECGKIVFPPYLLIVFLILNNTKSLGKKFDAMMTRQVNH
jgi:hypothetical protein